VPELNAIGIAVSDMARSIRFYRLVGLDVPETPDEGHVDAFLPNGVRFMLDSEEVIRSFMPDWSRENGNQLSFALECASPAEVDEVYARVTGEGFEGEKGRVLGPALRAVDRPGRRAGQPVRGALSSRGSGRECTSTSVRVGRVSAT
jgi:catechol 2,3-dioxygenase-like lactoylglutathione lyase family enzyme